MKKKDLRPRMPDEIKPNEIMTEEDLLRHSSELHPIIVEGLEKPFYMRRPKYSEVMKFNPFPRKDPNEYTAEDTEKLRQRTYEYMSLLIEQPKKSAEFWSRADNAVVLAYQRKYFELIGMRNLPALKNLTRG